MFYSCRSSFCTRLMLWTVLDTLSGHSDLVGIWPDCLMKVSFHLCVCECISSYLCISAYFCRNVIEFSLEGMQECHVLLHLLGLVTQRVKSC